MDISLRTDGSAVCTFCSNAVAFSIPFPASARAARWNLRRACSWTSQPAVQARVSSFQGCRLIHTSNRRQERVAVRVAPKAMFSGGGFLGVGPSEVVVIVAVGWVLLGPEKLFSLAKDSGKFLGQLRRTADEAKETFSEALDIDMITAEANALSNQVQSGVKEAYESEIPKKDAGGVAVSTSPAEATTQQQPAAMPNADSHESIVENTPPDPEREAGGSAAFLDQLRRASDPNQVAPSEIPDVSSDIDELEVERLERDYMDAKKKLEERRARARVEENPNLKDGV